MRLGWPATRHATTATGVTSDGTVSTVQGATAAIAPIMPQFALSAVRRRRTGTAARCLNRRVPPPPQVSPAFVQVPQLTVPLQPSDSSPQLALIAPHASVAVLGVQPPDEPPHWKNAAAATGLGRGTGTAVDRSTLAVADQAAVGVDCGATPRLGRCSYRRWHSDRCPHRRCRHPRCCRNSPTRSPTLIGSDAGRGGWRWVGCDESVAQGTASQGAANSQ